MKAFSLTKLIHSQCQKVVTKPPHLRCPLGRSGLLNISFTPWNPLSVKEIRLPCRAALGFHVQIILAVKGFQLLSYSIHRCMFSQIYPMVKSKLSSFERIFLVVLNFVNGSAAAIAVDSQRIDNGHKIPWSCNSIATGSWYLPVASITTLVFSPWERIRYARRS